MKEKNIKNVSYAIAAGLLIGSTGFTAMAAPIAKTPVIAAK